MGHGLLHASAQLDRAGSCSGVAQTFLNHGLCQHGGCGGAVASLVFGFRRHLLNQLGADVFEGIVEFDLLGDGVAVIDDVRSAEAFLQNHVASAGADRDAHGIGKGVHAALERAAGLIRKAEEFGHVLQVPAGQCPTGS